MTSTWVLREVAWITAKHAFEHVTTYKNAFISIALSYFLHCFTAFSEVMYSGVEYVVNMLEDPKMCPNTYTSGSQNENRIRASITCKAIEIFL